VIAVVVVVLLDFCCVCKVLSTLSRFVYIFADAWTACGLFTSVYRTRRDFSDAGGDYSRGVHGPLILTLWCKHSFSNSLSL
jgi:hypothetical protein